MFPPKNPEYIDQRAVITPPVNKTPSPNNSKTFWKCLPKGPMWEIRIPLLKRAVNANSAPKETKKGGPKRGRVLRTVTVKRKIYPFPLLWENPGSRRLFSCKATAGCSGNSSKMKGQKRPSIENFRILENRQKFRKKRTVKNRPGNFWEARLNRG